MQTHPRYVFTATFDDGSIEPGGGNAWSALKILRLQRRRGGFALSAIVDIETGKEVSESDLMKAAASETLESEVE